MATVLHQEQPRNEQTPFCFVLLILHILHLQKPYKRLLSLLESENLLEN